MIEAIALRTFRRNGAEYAKDTRVTLTEGEFAELSGVGLVSEAPKPKFITSKAHEA